MTESFCKMPRPLMAATQWVSLTTGEHLALSGQDKILWAWMKDRYDFFTSQHKNWFDNQDDIAKYTGCSVSTVKRFIQLLNKHGYLKKTQRRVHGFAYSNSYTIVQDLVLASVEKVTPLPLPLVQEERTPDYAPIIFPVALTHAEPVAVSPEPVRLAAREQAGWDDEPQWNIRSSG
ncbi:helix-turn-helix domain-containing protein [Pseudomonas proteolytica]|uniref:helix-turn-helix domain-containing protein n=1 Tax=Pseudomonas proteolytica TaxID=219574 RepID=UPI0030D98895